MILQDIGELEENVPEGFRLEEQYDGSVTIHYRRTGMGCMNLFLIFWLSFWTIGCVWLLYSYLNGGEMDDGDPIPLWFVAIFWFFEIGVAILLARLLFERRTYRLSEDKLSMVTKVLCYKRSIIIPRNSIHRMVQVKDGGGDDDSFPSWGLELEAEKEFSLIYRQPHEISLWLGQVLAHWAQVEFSSLPED